MGRNGYMLVSSQTHSLVSRRKGKFAKGNANSKHGVLLADFSDLEQLELEMTVRCITKGEL